MPPGVRVNFKKAPSISFGGKGLRCSVSTTGRRTTSAVISGNGLSYVKNNFTNKKSSTPNAMNVQKNT
ncbi:DUF4236 domain-containing protein [Solibacillus sp. FSL H8-0538]|uniref:DUF4236 domain-containing protein n=1 Tax=Solibacillus sp. FSL H8-0538 TaxID=2921400 RepID=UPI004046BCAF